MKNKLLILSLVMIFVLGISINVYAEDVYYTTPNGIELTREEYDFLTDFYGAGYLNVMSQDQYDEFVELDLMNSDVTIKKSTAPSTILIRPGNVSSPQSNSTSTQAKTLQIGAACLPTKCIISLVNTWHVEPSVTSWDVIGTYLDDVTLLSYSHTYVSTSNTTLYYDNRVYDTNGFGNSVKLPDYGTNMIVNMAFNVSRDGTVYGSYQHAAQETTLANSQLYNIDFGGYGAVFDFYGTAFGIYDGMNGVDVDV